MKYSRRRFAKTLFLSGAALAASPLFSDLSPEAGADKSLVVQAVSPRLRRRDHDMPRDAAREFLDLSLQAITGKAGPAAAWGSLFAAHETVGIKLSCLPGRMLSSSPGLVAAIVDGLLAAGLDKKNIIIWERTSRELENAGYEISRSGLKTMGSDELPGLGYGSHIATAGSVGTVFSGILEGVDALISVPVLKDHNLAGVSLGMKGFYGAIHNPNKYHDDNCDPFIVDVVSHRFVRPRWRLTVCDATRGQCHGGPSKHPGYAWAFGGLIVGTDFVAVDAVGADLLEAERKARGLKSLAEENRPPRHIATAGVRGLGVADLAKIERVEV